MKLRLIFFLTFFCSFAVPSTSQAQVLISLLFGDKLNNENNMFGLHLDYSSNQISGLEPSKSLGTLNFGLFYTHSWENNLELNIGMLAKYRRGATGIPAYSLEDADLTAQFEDTEVTKKISYMSLPISMRYKSPKGLFIELGPQVSYRLKAFDLFEASATSGDLKLDVDIRDQIKKVDFGYLAGVGAYIGKDKINVLGLRYQGGFSDIMINQAGKQTYGQWAVYTNIPIGRGKMKDN
jgi:hypothetical protein